MKTLDALIEQLKEVKEELNKAMPNMTYRGAVNEATPGTSAMKSEGVTHRPEAGVHSRVGPAFSDKKDVGNGRMVAGDSPSPCEVDKKLMSNIATKSEDDQPPARDADKKKVPMNKGESCSIAKNGQWDLKKDAVNPQLAPKAVKIKELQNKIDLGQYKPNSEKIADKMISSKEKPLK